MNNLLNGTGYLFKFLESVLFNASEYLALKLLRKVYIKQRLIILRVWNEMGNTAQNFMVTCVKPGYTATQMPLIQTYKQIYCCDLWCKHKMEPLQIL